MWGPVKLNKRKRTYQTSVEVDVDVSLEDILSDDLILELQERGDWEDNEEETKEVLAEVLQAIRRRDLSEAELLIERHLFPKWPTPKAIKLAEAELAKMKRVQPSEEK